MENELQLLVIDAGECCFLKVEKGRFETMLFDDDIGGLGFRIISHPFTKLREALEQKPVPRIEVDGGRMNYYRVVTDHVLESPLICPDTYKALSQLAGKPLPVWSGGKWERLNTHDWTLAKKVATERGYSIDTFSFEESICPVKIWRYTQ